MESINLAAVLFALLILVWLGYAVPRIAERRDLMGQTRAVDRARDSSTVRDLSSAARARRRPPEVTAPMPTNRLLSRPTGSGVRTLPAGSSPQRSTSAPTPSARHLPTAAHLPMAGHLPVAGVPGGTRPDLAARTRAGMRIALLAMLGLTLIGVIGAWMGLWSALLPLLALVLAAADIALLVRAESVARERARRAATRRRADRTSPVRPSGDHDREVAVSAESPSPAAIGTAAEGGDSEQTVPPAPSESVRRDAPIGQPAAGASAEKEREAPRSMDEVARSLHLGDVPREWMPRPVPRPTYALRGEVEDLPLRHEVHRRSVLGAAVPFEREDVEIIEARVEQIPQLAPAVDLDLDAVLARRRGA